MHPSFQEHLRSQLDQIRAAGLYKAERIITTPQDAHIKVADGREVLNMCANNYLGLAEHPEVVAAAHAALDPGGDRRGGLTRRQRLRYQATPAAARMSR